ncbi:MAG TPA: VOC family protein [candidate division Zixibacteria bacterium]|nr:VOC family protein [candidate division Zixibacteria bacterium]
MVMKLGEATQIAIGCEDVQKSFAFYQKLGFQKITGDTLPYPWMQISDGSILLHLNQDGQKYMGLAYFSKEMDKKVQELEKMGIKFALKSKMKDSSFWIFLSPDSLAVNLIHHDPAGIYQPQGKTLLNFPQEDFAQPEKFPNPQCGIFGEFATPVRDLNSAVAFWQGLGFEAKSVNQQPYPWAILSDGMNILGLHQTKDFDYPAITYFAPDMAERVKKLKEAGITAFSDWKGEGGSAGNFILTTPEGQRIFLFSF